MSGNAQGRTGSQPDGDEVTTGEALLMAGYVLLLMIFLVVLRFGFNICLDCCVLDARDRAWRSIAEVFRKVFPFWHRRTQPEDLSSDDVELAGNAQPQQNDTAAFRKAFLRQNIPYCSLSSIHFQKQQEINNSALESPERMNGGMDIDSNPQTCSFSCSICLQDMEESDLVFIAKNCQHIFHFNCITDWMAVPVNDCPNCRTEILPQAILNQMIAGRELRLEEKELYFGIESTPP